MLLCNNAAWGFTRVVHLERFSFATAATLPACVPSTRMYASMFEGSHVIPARRLRCSHERRLLRNDLGVFRRHVGEMRPGRFRSQAPLTPLAQEV